MATHFQSMVMLTRIWMETDNERADLVGNPYLPSGRSEGAKLDEWFNAAAFQNAASGTVGNSPRNFLRGPGFFNLDYSLIKSFPIRYGPFKETQKIDFRAEFFNLFNHPNFGLPSQSWVFNPLYPQITVCRQPSDHPVRAEVHLLRLRY